MKKLLSVLLILCLSLPVALAGWEDEPYHFPQVVVSGENKSKEYKSFYNSGELSLVIPGCSQDFIPQGIAYYSERDLVFFSGYSSNEGMPCALMAVDRKTNQVVKEIFLAYPDGREFCEHAGGVCVTDKNIFISDESHLYRMSLETFLTADNSCLYNFDEAIPVPCNASFCQISNGILWVGEFHHIPKDPTQKAFRTDPSHRVDATSGQQNAWLVGYRLSGGTENELDTACITAAGAIPDYILSIPDRIQGFTICNDQLYLSQSYGRTNESTIFRYNNVLANAPDQQVSVLGSTRPLWVLDANAPDCKKLTAPPMSEGLCTIGDSVFISFESAAQTYRQPKDPSKGVSKDPVDRVIKLNPSAF